MNIIEALNNTYAIHKNAPHAVLMGCLRARVEMINQSEMLRLDPVREVDDFLALRARLA